MKDSLVFQIQQLIKRNKISIYKDELIFKIKNDSPHPILCSTKEVFNINTFDLKNQVNDLIISQLQLTSLTHTIADKNIKSNSQYKALSPFKVLQKTVTNLSTKTTEFAAFFGQIFEKIIVLFCVLCITSFFYIISISLNNTILSLLTVMGILISISIYKQETGKISLLETASYFKRNNIRKALYSKNSYLSTILSLSELIIINCIALLLTDYTTNFDISTLSKIEIILIVLIILIIYSSWSFFRQKFKRN